LSRDIQTNKQQTIRFLYSAAVLGYHGWQESFHSAQILHTSAWYLSVVVAEECEDPCHTCTYNDLLVELTRLGIMEDKLYNLYVILYGKRKC